MKKIIFCIGIILFLSGSAFAGLHIDVGGAFNGAGDAKYQGGASWAIAWGLNDNINIIYRGSFTLTSLDKTDPFRAAGSQGLGYYTSNNDESPTRDYEQMFQLFGVEYIYHFSKLPLAVKGSLMVGMSKTDITYPNLDTSINWSGMGSGTSSNPWRMNNDWNEEGSGDMGVAFGVWAGVVYHATQYIAPFLDFGYVFSYYAGEYKDKSIHGISVMLGLRFSIYWKNRGLLDEY